MQNLKDIMARKWAVLYQEQVVKLGPYEFYLTKIKEKRALLQLILKYAVPGASILEAGCGTGVLSLYLSFRGFRVVAVDISREMLDISKHLARILQQGRSRINYLQGNLFHLPFSSNTFDIVHSHGVLEHFSDQEIIWLLKEQLRVSRLVIVSIPSNYFILAERMFGNERFLSPAYWESLFFQSNARILEWFSFDYHQGFSRILSTMRRKLFADGVAPYLVYVVTKK